MLIDVDWEVEALEVSISFCDAEMVLGAKEDEDREDVDELEVPSVALECVIAGSFNIAVIMGGEAGGFGIRWCE